MKLIGFAFSLCALLGGRADAGSFSTLSCFNNESVTSWETVHSEGTDFEVRVGNYGSAVLAEHFGLPGIIVEIVSMEGSRCQDLTSSLYCSSDVAQVRSHTFDPESGNWVPGPFHSTYDLHMTATWHDDLWSITVTATDVNTQERFAETYGGFSCRAEG